MEERVETPFVPDWAHDSVWYQVFPERFRNGAPSSSPLREDLGTATPSSWTLMPWGMDWYERASWECECGGFYDSVYLRRYGGDLVGLRDKLDYLQDLGVNALYLNPVFMAPSLHKYDGSAFHHIDPTFGPDREGDVAALRAAAETEDPATWIWTAADRFFLDLVADLHARGMRIILDGVFNHCGREFFAFRDLLKNGKASRYTDWFRIKRWRKDGRFSYKGWFGHQGLPEFARTQDNLAEPVRDYIFNITRRWMDPNGDGDPRHGIDGWRLDVAFCVPIGFWRAWRKLVRTLNPEAYLTGEIVKLAPRYLQGDVFDAVMNYMWLYPAADFLAPGHTASDAATCRRKLNRVFRSYPKQVWPVLQNLLDSHDVGRIATMFENPDLPKAHWDDYFAATRAKHKRTLVTSKPGERAYQALRQLIILQMTFPGAPMLYYGTEVGMWGANDPDNRQPMLWDDIPSSPETRTHAGSCPPASRCPDRVLFGFVRRAIALRKAHRVFRRGSFAWLKERRARVLAFQRYDEKKRILVLLNASDQDEPFQLDQPATDLWADEKMDVSGEVAIPARGWRVLESAGSA